MIDVEEEVLTLYIISSGDGNGGRGSWRTLNNREWSELLTYPKKKDQPQQQQQQQQQQRQHQQQQDDTVDDVDADDVLTSMSTSSREENKSCDWTQ